MIQPERVSQRIPRHWEQEAISGARILASLGLGYQRLSPGCQVARLPGSFILPRPDHTGGFRDGWWMAQLYHLGTLFYSRGLDELKPLGGLHLAFGRLQMLLAEPMFIFPIFSNCNVPLRLQL